MVAVHFDGMGDGCDRLRGNFRKEAPRLAVSATGSPFPISMMTFSDVQALVRLRQNGMTPDSIRAILLKGGLLSGLIGK